VFGEVSGSKKAASRRLLSGIRDRGSAAEKKRFNAKGAIDTRRTRWDLSGGAAFASFG
jgi:hypothetical protein